MKNRNLNLRSLTFFLVFISCAFLPADEIDTQGSSRYFGRTNVTDIEIIKHTSLHEKLTSFQYVTLEKQKKESLSFYSQSISANTIQFLLASDTFASGSFRCSQTDSPVYKIISILQKTTISHQSSDDPFPQASC